MLHHYRIDENGLIVWANLIIATDHNNLAMNRGGLQVARHFVDGERLQEGMLNRVEAVIRAYDPCLSCSTHAPGKMPLRIRRRRTVLCWTRWCVERTMHSTRLVIAYGNPLRSDDGLGRDRAAAQK